MCGGYENAKQATDTIHEKAAEESGSGGSGGGGGGGSGSETAFLLDIDGTLAITDDLYFAVFADLLKPFGYDVTDEFYKVKPIIPPSVW